MINERYIFRGKIKYSEKSALRRKNGKWVQGFYRDKIFADGTTACVCDYPVDPATVGQCTGLRDKHGKLIFEGDVVKTVSGEEEPEIYRVEWKNYRWELTNTVYDYPQELEEYTDDDTTLEIIGNVHDTADLLEATE